MARKPAPAQPAPAPRAWRPQWLTLPSVEAASSSIRIVLINLAVLSLLLLIVPLIATQFARDQILLAPISVPPALMATGLTPDVAANRLWDGIQQIEAEAHSGKSTVNVLPEGKKVTFSIPDAGISVDSLVYYVRQFFNLHEIVVSGEFRCGDAACTPALVSLRLRVYGKDLKVIELPPMRRDTEAEYWRQAASQVMAELDPFTALAAEVDAHPNNAAAIARRLILTNNKDAKWAHNILGNIRRSAGYAADAVVEYQAALDIDPNFPRALANMSGVLGEQGKFAEAMVWADRLAKADKTSPLEPAVRGELARDQGQVDQARDFYLEAFRRDPLNSDYQTKAAKMLIDAGRDQEGLTLAKDALALNPSDPAPLYLLGAYYMNKGDFATAEPFFRDAAEFSPNDAKAQSFDANLLMIMHDYPRALARADQAVLIDEGNVQYHLLRAQALAALDRNQDAMLDLDEAWAREPNNVEVAAERASTLLALNRRSESAQAYKDYLALAPEGTYAVIAKAMIASIENREPPAVAEPEAVPAPPDSGPVAPGLASGTSQPE